MKFAALLLLVVSSAFAARAASQVYAAPRFSDVDRRKQIEAVIPQIDRVYAELAAERHIPGIAYGLVLDGELIHAGVTGFANVEKKIPAATDIRFRIASMTKSFTAMAIFK